MKNIIQSIIEENSAIIGSQSIKQRDYDFSRYFDTDKIIVLTGFRRVGKTFLLFDIYKKIGDVPKVYINFEDERLIKIDLTDLLDALIEIYGDKNFFLFFDEIQGISNWSKFVRRLYDSKKYRLFLSGSSSKLGSKEIPTELRGRELSFNVIPLSFPEFIMFKGVEKTLPKNDLIIKNLFDEYLKTGGFPEIVNLDMYKKREIVEEYLKTLLQRDIIERYKVKKEEALRGAIQLLLNSSYLTFSKLFNSLRSLGFDASKNTVINYLRYIEDSFFLYPVRIFSKKAKDELQYYRKIYFIDNSFISFYSRNKEIWGRLLENAVFLELLRMKKEVRYYLLKNKKEIDFLILDNLAPEQLIEVSYSLADYETRKLKIKNMMNGLKELNLNKGLILTYDEEETVKKNGYEIQVLPAWKWLMGDYSGK